MTDRTLFDKLEPIDPRTLVTRIPGIDAVCEAGKGELDCRWPYCVCYAPDRWPREESA